MKRKWLWFVAVGLASALMLAAVGNLSPTGNSLQPTALLEQAALAQSPSPNASPTEDAASPESSPSPAASPTESPTASPAAPAASPTPAEAPTEAVDETATLERYTDPGNRFEVAILEEYQVSNVAGVALIESPDGNIAYTVVAKQRATDAPLAEAALTQITIEAFQDGEGFQPGEVTATESGIQMAWIGGVTVGRPPAQPISGQILTQQAGQNVLMLAISATEAGAENLDAAIAQISATFKPL